MSWRAVFLARRKVAFIARDLPPFDCLKAVDFNFIHKREAFGNIL
jgi:hypothetical protein